MPDGPGRRHAGAWPGPDSNDEFDGQVPVMVSVDRLDAFCTREAIGRVDFVKIDVEGAELQVPHGGREVIEAPTPSAGNDRGPFLLLMATRRADTVNLAAPSPPQVRRKYICPDLPVPEPPR